MSVQIAWVRAAGRTPQHTKGSGGCRQESGEVEELGQGPGEAEGRSRTPAFQWYRYRPMPCGSRAYGLVVSGHGVRCTPCPPEPLTLPSLPHMQAKDATDAIQKLTDKFTKTIDERVAAKEKDILKV